MTQNIQLLLLAIIPFVLAICFHEAAHAYAAYKLGDHTAKSLGRMSLNPAVHIDLVGTIIFPVMGMLFNLPIFGWAKPVPVDSRNLSWRKYGMLAVAAAGPLSNILLCVISSLVYVLFLAWVSPEFYLQEAFKGMLEQSIIINVVLAVFNLIPIPPLDGSKIIEPFLSYNFKKMLEPYAGWSFMILIMLMMSGVFSVVLRPCLVLLNYFISFLTQILGLFI